MLRNIICRTYVSTVQSYNFNTNYASVFLLIKVKIW